MVILAGCGTCNIKEPGSLANKSISTNSGGAEPSKPNYVQNEIIIKYRSDAIDHALTPSLQGYRIQKQTSVGDLLVAIPEAKINDLVTKGKAANQTEAIQEIIRQLSQDPNVEYVHPNWIFEAFDVVPNDKCYQQKRQWSLECSDAGICMPKAWNTSKGSATVVASVLDTGLIDNHKDFNLSNIVPGYNFVDNTINTIDEGPYNGYHGSHVAGTIGVVATNNSEGVAAINWSVAIQPVKVLDKYGSGTYAGIVDAIKWASGYPITGIPTNTTPAKVINMSLGGFVSCASVPGMQKAIDDATSKGVLVVVAAGNSNYDAAYFSPAGCKNVLTVAASGPDGHIAYYSNWGTVVGILAPGGDQSKDPAGGIVSTYPGGYVFYQGTSMASPHVAGVAALYLATNPNATPSQVTDLLKSKSKPRTPADCNNKPCGAGLLNANIWN